MRKNITGQQHPFFQGRSGEPQVIAHRGGAGEWPGETIYAFKQAVALGVDILEMDIRHTKDGGIFLMHNRNVKDTTGEDLKIRKMEAKDVRNLDASHWWRVRGMSFPSGPDLKVPELKQVLNEFRDHEQRIVIEIKPRFFPRELIEELGMLITSLGMTDRVLVASGWHRPLRIFRKKFDKIATSASILEMIGFRYLGIRPNAQAIQTISRAWIFERINEKFIKRANAAGLAVDGWTVNHPEEMGRLIKAGIDGIITDQPTTLMKLLGRI